MKSIAVATFLQPGDCLGPLQQSGQTLGDGVKPVNSHWNLRCVLRFCGCCRVAGHSGGGL